MIIEQSEFDRHDISKLIKGTVVPRPIAWVSSVGKDGTLNLAPYSFFNVISSDPVILGFSVGQGRKIGKDGDKDTLANIKETGDYVINMVSASLAAAMHKSSKVFNKNVSEFEMAGLHPVKSNIVKSPRVEEAPISMECTLDRVIELGSANLVIGNMVCYHIKDEVYMEVDKVDPHALDPVGRMAADYTYVRDFFYPED